MMTVVITTLLLWIAGNLEVLFGVPSSGVMLTPDFSSLFTNFQLEMCG
jgi:hypothetical protein